MSYTHIVLIFESQKSIGGSVESPMDSDNAIVVFRIRKKDMLQKKPKDTWKRKNWSYRTLEIREKEKKKSLWKKEDFL